MANTAYETTSTDTSADRGGKMREGSKAEEARDRKDMKRLLKKRKRGTIAGPDAEGAADLAAMARMRGM